MGTLQEQKEPKSYLFFPYIFYHEVIMIKVSWEIGYVEKADARSHQNHPLNHRAINLWRLEENINVIPENNQQLLSQIYITVFWKILWVCVAKVSFFVEIASNKGDG